MQLKEEKAQYLVTKKGLVSVIVTKMLITTSIWPAFSIFKNFVKKHDMSPKNHMTAPDRKLAKVFMMLIWNEKNWCYYQKYIQFTFEIII